MDQTVIWIIALGLIVLGLGCCVMVALRQVTVLRESVTHLNHHLAALRDEQKKQKASGSNYDILGLQMDQQRNEQDTLATRLVTVERDLQVTTERLFEAQSKIQQTSSSGGAAASPSAGGGGVAQQGSPGGDGDEEGSPLGGGGKKREASKVFEDILSELRAQSSIVEMAPPSHSDSFHNTSSGTPNRRVGGNLLATLSGSAPSGGGSPNQRGGGGGDSALLPSPFLVYQHTSSGLYSQGQFKRLMHKIRLGVDSHDVELVFTPTMTAQQQIRTASKRGFNDVSNTNAVERENEANAFVVILGNLQEVKMDTDAELPDGSPCLRVELHSKQRPPAPGENPNTSFRRREAFRTVSESRKEVDSTFTFLAPLSPEVEEWMAFVTDHCGDALVYPPL